MSEISNDNEISSFMHCGRCLAELTDAGYTQLLNVGYTRQGLQVWCKIHDCNVIHIDFGGMKFHANTTAKPDVLEASEIGS